MNNLAYSIFILACWSYGSINSYAQDIKTVSEMKKVMMGQDLSPHLLWDTIPHQNLFGISPLGRIEGEITIIEGQIFVSKVGKQGTIQIQQDWQATAPFGVYAHVPAWQSLPWQARTEDEKTLQTELEKIALAQGYDLSKPFAFRLKGTFEQVDFHIISKPAKEKKHSHELHDKAKKHFSLQNTQGELLGFYSQKHQGIFTHRGSFLHIHFIDDARQNMGHVESLKISQHLILLLPQLK